MKNTGPHDGCKKCRSTHVFPFPLKKKSCIMTLFLILFYLLKIKQKLVATPTFQKKEISFFIIK